MAWLRTPGELIANPEEGLEAPPPTPNPGGFKIHAL